MKLAAGQEVYAVDRSRVMARGLAYTENEVSSALRDRLPSLLRDDAGRAEMAMAVEGLANTAFEQDRLRSILDPPVQVEDWRVGEAIAEAFLTDHCGCEFPWPFGRDVRNPKASPAGADLVGFQVQGGTNRLAFGEVKTSAEEKSPPQVMTGRHGMTQQLERLRDDGATKDHLFRYLAIRAHQAAWEQRFQEAASRYIADNCDVSLFGVLIRDTAPNELDLKNRARVLANGCSQATLVELRAMYLPEASIQGLAERAVQCLSEKQ